MTPPERRWASLAHLTSIPGMLADLGFLGPALVLPDAMKERGLRSW